MKHETTEYDAWLRSLRPGDGVRILCTRNSSAAMGHCDAWEKGKLRVVVDAGLASEITRSFGNAPAWDKFGEDGRTPDGWYRLEPVP